MLLTVKEKTYEINVDHLNEDIKQFPQCTSNYSMT